jgi:hypothetical protein
MASKSFFGISPPPHRRPAQILRPPPAFVKKKILPPATRCGSAVCGHRKKSLAAPRRAVLRFAANSREGQMTPEHDKHLASLLSTIKTLTTTKYKAGVIEHGGSLWLKGKHYLIDQAIMEAIDQLTYLLTLRQVLRDEENFNADLPPCD